MSNTEQPAPVGRILVVDDESINREVLGALLAGDGHSVLEANSGLEALEVIARTPVDLVLLDVVMPGIGGFETCRRIRDEMGLLTLPVVFVTGLEDRDSRVQGKAIGGDDFLTKPVDPVEVSVRVRNLLRVKAYHDLLARQKEILEQELDLAREQVLRADRLATLGTLAAGVGHELTNVATALKGALDYTRRRAEQGSAPSEDDLQILDRASEHVRTHARQLLDLGRPGPQYAEVVDLREVLASTVQMLRVAGKTKILQVELELPPAPVLVEVNRTRIEQVVVNLVINAADAVSAAKKRDKRVWVRMADPGSGRVRVCIEDNGCGIPKDKLAAVFEPYYTTKAAGLGTGLGLSVVASIVESYAGSVVLTSEEGRGTKACFDLPTKVSPRC